jgi:hypothetical protein
MLFLIASGSIPITFSFINITTVIFYGIPRVAWLLARERRGRAQSPRGLPPTPLRGRELQLFRRIVKASPRVLMSQTMLEAFT